MAVTILVLCETFKLLRKKWGKGVKYSYFQWDNELITGFESIDEQHQRLIGIINDALQLCFANEKIQKDQIKEIYRDLKTYVSEHFRDEEGLMTRAKVDPRHADQHLELHEEFEHKIDDFFKDLLALTDPEILGEVSEYLIRWLAYHILNFDKSLVRQMHAIQAEGLAPEQAYLYEQNMLESSSEPLLKALKALFYLVSEKNKALTVANLELEEKVHIRTSELLEANKKLKEIALIDELTGLPNRRFALQEISKLMSQYKRYQEAFTLLYIDVDKFKVVNDDHGHDIGDQVLNWIARFLHENTRKSDLACRLGGDEFLIICTHCDAQNALKLATKLSEMCKTLDLGLLKAYWNPSCSIGVAEVDSNCFTPSDLLRKADHAMYLAKKKGNGTAELAISEGHDR